MRPADIFGLRTLLRNQWKTPAEVREIQNRKLKRLIRHAYQNVPYYRDLFDATHIKPEDIREVDDLRNVPITTRQTLNNLKKEEMMAQGIDPKDVHRKLVENVMEDAYPTVNEETPVELLYPMLDFFQAILVTRKDKVVGIIAKSDLLKLD